eukprot:jgi/Antlo1/28/1276
MKKIILKRRLQPLSERFLHVLAVLQHSSTSSRCFSVTSIAFCSLFVFFSKIKQKTCLFVLPLPPSICLHFPPLRLCHLLLCTKRLCASLCFLFLVIVPFWLDDYRLGHRRKPTHLLDDLNLCLLSNDLFHSLFVKGTRCCGPRHVSGIYFPVAERLHLLVQKKKRTRVVRDSYQPRPLRDLVAAVHAHAFFDIFLCL